MPIKPISNEKKQRWKDFFAEYSHTEKTYSTMSALHKLAQYSVENELIIEQAAIEEVENNGPKWMPDSNDDDSIGEFFSERDLARYMHDNTMLPMHRYSCIVMLFATLEREFIRLIENLESGKWKKIRDEKAAKNRTANPMTEARNFILASRGVKFADCPLYTALTDLQKIRDCIIHCKGEVALSRDKEHLVEFWLGEKNKSKKRRGFAAHWNSTIFISPECFKQFSLEIWAFFEWLFGRLTWGIASQWQGNKLEQVFERLKG